MARNSLGILQRPVLLWSKSTATWFIFLACDVRKTFPLFQEKTCNVQKRRRG
jgi:hypothetical protein